MIRTQVYLTEDQARDIRLKARKEQKPEAQVIREVLNAGLHASTPASGETIGQALLRVAETGKRLGITGPRYDLKLWIGHLFEGAAYLPR